MLNEDGRWRPWVAQDEFDFPLAAPLDATAEELQEAGDEFLSLGRWRGAVTHYSSGLALAPYDVQLRLSRAVALIRLKEFRGALTDAEFVLEENGRDITAVLRKIEALCGLRRCDEALQFLQTCSVWIPRLVYGELVQRLRRQQSQATCGEYDWRGIRRRHNATKGRGVLDDCVEFVNDKIAVKEIAGKGHGFVAIKAVEKGELLLACKAVVIGDSGRMRRDVPTWTDFKNEPTLVALLARLDRDVELRRQIYSLHAGDMPPLQLEENGEDPALDPARVAAIFSTCGFKAGGRYGLWLEPSFVNHSCSDANSKIDIFCDFLFLRAFKPIPEGEEVTTQRVDGRRMWSRRQRRLGALGVRCSCKGCRTDKRENPATILLREELQHLIEAYGAVLEAGVCRDPRSNIRVLPSTARALYEAVVKSRALRPNFNGHLFEGYFLLGQYFFLRRTEGDIGPSMSSDIQAAVRLFTLARECIADCSYPQPRVAAWLCLCFSEQLRLKEVGGAVGFGKWWRVFEEETRSMWGSKDFVDMTLPAEQWAVLGRALKETGQVKKNAG